MNGRNKMSKIRTFFLRIAARCNLNCDYCYVFKHRDMSWKNMPPIMDDKTVSMFAKRLLNYIKSNSDIDEVNVIFHGGEPLIAGEETLFRFVEIIENTVGETANVNFSLQTNGTLLTDQILMKFEEKNIGVSLSIDGPTKAHNRHRKYISGKGSFEDVLNGAKLLLKYPNIFEGIIGVIDPNNDPDELLNFYSENGLINMDLLLPDSTYDDKPIGREENKNLYKDWLNKCFDLWFTKYQDLNFRTFEGILSSLVGVKTQSDTFGLGELDYLTIETDGAYHTTDILKITYENASHMNMTIFDTEINDALNDSSIKEYNKLLSYDNLSEKCKKCRWIHVCGGGSLPHRYSSDSGFNNPTIYCEEMYSLIEHASTVLSQEMQKEENEK